MPFFGRLLLAVLLARPALAAEPDALGLPPPAPRAEPRASSRAPLEERRPVELLAHGRAWRRLTAQGGAPGDSAALGGGAGVGFRTSPYFSLGGEASAARSRTTSGPSLELAVVARVYLLEAGLLDPYLELALGYELSHTGGPAAPGRRHGSSARAGGGVDLVVLSPLRLGALVSYREVAHFPRARCSPVCRMSAEGGVLAGLTVTLPLGQPL